MHHLSRGLTPSAPTGPASRAAGRRSRVPAGRAWPGVLGFAALVVLSRGLAVAQEAPGVPGSWSVLIGGPPPAGQLATPWSVAADEAGTVFVADVSNQRIERFAPDGQPLGAWGWLGSAPGAFAEPSGVALSADGRVYVADTSNHRVQVLTRDGEPLAQIGDAGQFSSPRAVALAGDGSVYVSDTFGYRIQKLAPDGTVLATLSLPQGSEAGQLRNPASQFAVDAEGVVYIADNGNDRVQALAANGRPVRVWGSAAVPAAQRSSPQGVALDRQQRLWVLDSLGRVQQLARDGQVLSAWSVPEAASPSGIRRILGGPFLGADDRVYLVDRISRRVLRFSRDGRLEMTFGVDPSSPEQLQMPTGVAADGAGRIYLTDLNAGRVLQLDAAGTVLATWDVPPAGEADRLGWPGTLATDAQDNVYLAAASMVQKRAPTGEVLAEWLLPGTSPTYEVLGGLAVDGDGNLYRVDARRVAIRSYSPDGQLRAIWGSRGTEPGQFNHPAGLAVDVEGFLYVADTWNHRVQKLTARGEVVQIFGPAEGRENPLWFPEAVAVDPDGVVFVADAGHNRVQAFTPDGDPLAQWGWRGGAPGEFTRPWAIAVQGRETILVSDPFNRRVQVFRRTQAEGVP